MYGLILIKLYFSEEISLFWCPLAAWLYRNISESTVVLIPYLSCVWHPVWLCDTVCDTQHCRHINIRNVHRLRINRELLVSPVHCIESGKGKVPKTYSQIFKKDLRKYTYHVINMAFFYLLIVRFICYGYNNVKPG